jgi:hypothetical protein
MDVWQSQLLHLHIPLSQTFVATSLQSLINPEQKAFFDPTKVGSKKLLHPVIWPMSFFIFI